MALIRPSNDAQAWNRGPRPWRRLMRSLAKRPGLTRAIGAAQIAAGVYWALQQEDDE